MRNYLVDANVVRDGLAPSYFIEGMLWNVPADKFGKSYDDTFVQTFNYVTSADRSTFKCANGIHPLLRANSHVSWPPANCQTFLDALRGFWNGWRQPLPRTSLAIRYFRVPRITKDATAKLPYPRR